MSGVPGECITDSGGGTANGTKIVLGTCADSSAQRWTVDPDGTIRIFGKCLSLAAPASGIQRRPVVVRSRSYAAVEPHRRRHARQLNLGRRTISGDETALESPPASRTAEAGLEPTLAQAAGDEYANGYVSNADWHVW